MYESLMFEKKKHTHTNVDRIQADANAKKMALTIPIFSMKIKVFHVLVLCA